MTFTCAGSWDDGEGSSCGSDCGLFEASYSCDYHSPPMDNGQDDLDSPSSTLGTAAYEVSCELRAAQSNIIFPDPPAGQGQEEIVAPGGTTSFTFDFEEENDEGVAGNIDSCVLDPNDPGNGFEINGSPSLPESVPSGQTVTVTVDFEDPDNGADTYDTVLRCTYTDSDDTESDVSWPITVQVGGTAEFEVSKAYDDTNEAEVIVHRDCNGGFIPDQDQNPSPGHPIVFIVTEFDAGFLNCTITEDTPVGYAAWYKATGVDATEETDDWNQIGCIFEDIIGGDRQFCEIENRLIPITFDVRKVWFDEFPEFNNPMWARARYDGDGEGQVSNGLDNAEHHGNTLWFSGADSYDSFDVYPHWNGMTECTVTERVRDSSVETDDSDCFEVPVLLGQDKSPSVGEYECTIYNTRIYEGIPTLSQYGLGILALLMLGVGLLGFRRFA